MLSRFVKASLIVPAFAFVFVAIVGICGWLLASQPGSALLWFVELELRGPFRTVFEFLGSLGFSDPLRCAALAIGLVLACIVAARTGGLNQSFLINHAVLILLGVSFTSEISITTALLTKANPSIVLSFERVMADFSWLKAVVLGASLLSCGLTHYVILRRVRSLIFESR